MCSRPLNRVGCLLLVPTNSRNVAGMSFFVLNGAFYEPRKGYLNNYREHKLESVCSSLLYQLELRRTGPPTSTPHRTPDDKASLWGEGTRVENCVRGRMPKVQTGIRFFSEESRQSNQK